MVVLTTKLLRSKFSTNESELLAIIKEFKKHKANPDVENFYFGKDTPYHGYNIDNKLLLSHIHTVPLNDNEKLNIWNDKFKKNIERKSKGLSPITKTSDACLVYIKHPNGNYLLITFFSNPTAHKKNKERSLMNKLRDIADHFYFTGEVLQ